MSLPSPLLVDVFNFPEKIKNLAEAQWDILVCQARASNLLARLGHFLHEQKLADSIPDYVNRHFQSELLVCQAVTRSTFWEAERIQEALSPLKIKILFLKGAAYSLAHLPASQGRIYQDVDILVPKHRLNDVERMLMWHGWVDRTESEYDQKYYRQWMHELPPKYHRIRGTVLDVHHNLLPLTNKNAPDVASVFDEAVFVSDTKYLIPEHVDLVIHSATHLFHEGEFNNGLRDLSDLDLLIDTFSVEDGFWAKLWDKAEQLNLERPLFYALRYTRYFFKTPVPEEFLERINTIKPGYLSVMDFLFLRALMPDHPSCNDRWTGLARFLLYLRAHWLKMPLYLLIPHLLRKGWMRMSGRAGH